MASKGSKTEDTKTEHPFQAIVVCDGWGDEERWGPLVRRKKTEDEEYDDLEVGGEQRPWVSCRIVSRVWRKGSTRSSIPRSCLFRAYCAEKIEARVLGGLQS